MVRWYWSHWHTWRGGRTYGGQNQIFSHRWFTIFSYPWCSARRAPLSYNFIHWFIHHGNIWIHKWPALNISGFIGQLVRASLVSRGYGFKPRWSPDFFRLLYAFAKIASITARIIASLDFSYPAFNIWFISCIISFVDSFITRTPEPINDQLPTSVAS